MSVPAFLAHVAHVGSAATGRDRDRFGPLQLKGLQHRPGPLLCSAVLKIDFRIPLCVCPAVKKEG